MSVSQTARTGSEVDGGIAPPVSIAIVRAARSSAGLQAREELQHTEPEEDDAEANPERWHAGSRQERGDPGVESVVGPGERAARAAAL